MTSETLLRIAGVFGAVGVVVGAMGAHALPKLLVGLDANQLAERSGWLEIGVRYQMYHALALMALSLSTRPSLANSVAAWCWIVGILVFSGMLYTMTYTGIRVLGAIVPLGGVALIIGWIALVVGTFSRHAPGP